jgi:hypothetical protein
MQNVTGIEQINDRIITHTRLDPRPIFAAVWFTVFTTVAFLVAISNGGS